MSHNITNLRSPITPIFCVTCQFYINRAAAVNSCTVITLHIFPTRRNNIQCIYFWKTTLHISGGISTHHQEHTQLYLQYLVLVNRYCYLLLLWESWSWFECGLGIVPICFVAAVPKQIGTIPQLHSGQFQLSRNRGR